MGEHLQGSSDSPVPSASNESASPHESTPAQEPKGWDVPVVGIGASAGGLEAFRQFFITMPSESGIAFVLIQHLAPDHESLMAELLGRYTTMPVVEVEDRMRIQPNHVYLIPPNKYLSIDRGELYLTTPVERRGIRMPIDFFFCSLAEDQHARAVGIVLSGTGTDGTLGLRAIKSAGGMVIAQEPTSAQYDGMPRSAIATDVVDYVLPVAQMPEVLLRYAQHPYVNGESQAVGKGRLDHLHRILAVLQTRTGHNFSYYKHSTLLRRIDRRMGVRHMEHVDDYVQCLRADPEEVSTLFRDLLISVTSFFREPDAWQYLREAVIPQLVEETPVQGTIRMWSPGCASGEEPYSLAMLVLHHLRAVQKPCRIQIFATDIDEYALERARSGLYPKSIAADVPPPYLETFFTREPHAYRINKELREAVVFSVQNLISDPPFSKLDLISCRNMLIYLQPEVQQQIMGLLHFALRPGGWLFLGKSESIGYRQDLFQALSKELRIYQRLESEQLHFTEFPLRTDQNRANRAMRRPTPGHSLNLTTVVQQQLLREFVPATVLIDRNYEVLNLQGAVRQYLDFPEGEPTYDLTKIVMHGLRTKLRVALTKAMREKMPVTVSNARVRREGMFYPVSCFVRPVTEPAEARDLFLVTFRDEPSQALSIGTTDDVENDECMTVRQLELELETVRGDLQNSLEEMKTSNEELKASNEEIMAMNEELQSANEELETSKEELQSLNEALTALNTQLQENIRELEGTNDDLINLQVTTNIATLFLDLDLRIKRFSLAAQPLLHLIPADVGRPIEDISQKLISATRSPVSLRADAETVLDTLMPLERELQTPEGAWYIQRMLPYRTEKHQIEGVVATFTDVTRLKMVHESARAAESYLRLVADTLPACMSHVGPDECYRYVNKEFARWFGRDVEAIRGLHVREVVGEELYQRSKFYIDAALSGQVVSFENYRQTPQGETLWMLVHLVPQHKADGSGDGYFGLASDITALKRTQEALRASEERLCAIFQNATHGLALADPEGHFLQVNDTLTNMFGYTRAELCQMAIRDITHTEDLRSTLEYFGRLRSGELGTFTLEQRYRRQDATVFWAALSLSPVRRPDGTIETLIAIITDLTQRKETEVALQSALHADSDGRVSPSSGS
jgi:two-component system CheB/CheR fusion protein